MKNINRIGILALLLIWSSCAQILAAQDSPPGARSISSDDFVTKRPTRKAKESKKVRTKVIYKYIRVAERQSSGSNHTSVANFEPASSPRRPAVNQIGVTLWRLRPPDPGEDGVLFAVWPQEGKREMWVAERVGLETKFKVGDYIRIGIETKTAGYLYLFSREIRSDGSLGFPDMHFPESIFDDNFVTPGTIFDFPDRKENRAYLEFVVKEPGYAGDLITVVIAPREVSGLIRKQNGRLLNPERLDLIELGSNAAFFQREKAEDREGKLLSTSEVESSCGAAMRGLEKGKPATKDGCGKSVRGLSKDGPFPESIFEVKAAVGQPWAASFRLDVQR